MIITDSKQRSQGIERGEGGSLATRLFFRLLTVCIVCLCFSPPTLLPGQSASPNVEHQRIIIDAQAPSHAFPHFWERTFGSGRAILSLRESYREDLRAVKRATDFEYIRFHAILHDEVGLYDAVPGASPRYNFSYVDQIYDGLLANGVRPFVEISFMPKALASTPKQQGFWYHPYIAPPKDWGLWQDLIRNFASHLVARYGIEEVSKWYFEVWNEPNLDFWAGEPRQASYFTLYDRTAQALKSVSPRLRVGGPSTAQAAWVSEFVRHCVDTNVPLDFVSTHVYANDTAENVLGSHEQVSRLEMVIRAVKKVHDEVKASARPDLPVFFSEYNASYMNEPDVTDSAFMGPWLAYTISRCDGLVDMLAYWSFSDVFEEQGVVKKPFYGGYGLVAAGNIPKASYNAFALLHRLGSERITIDSDSVLATRRQDGALVIAAWNYASPGETGPARELTLEVRGLEAMRYANIFRLDDEHGSALTAWEAMGKPDFPSREQQQLLREAGRLPVPELRQLGASDPGSLTVTLPPHGLALIEIWK
jgi:xylan 1,4-beta-xylosidase